MPDPLRFQIRLPAHPVSVGMARGVVRALAPVLPAEGCERAELVLSELVTNSIRHASTGPNDVVDVMLTIADDGLTAVVQDHGPAFDVAPPPTGRRVGGFGLHIAKNLTDVTFGRSDEGNVVTFKIGAAD